MTFALRDPHTFGSTNTDSLPWLPIALVISPMRRYSGVSCHGPISVVHSQGTCLHEDMIQKVSNDVGLLFRKLPTLRLDAAVFESVDDLRREGTTVKL